MKYSKILPFFILLLSPVYLFAQTLYGNKQYSLVFNYDTYSNTKVDLSKMTVENSVVKPPAKLSLSTIEKRLIEQSFKKNRIELLRGEISCYNDTMIVAPTTDDVIEVYKHGKLILTISVNEYYELNTAKKTSKKYKAAHFVIDVKKMLENNPDFNKALKALRDYAEKNNFIRL